MIDLLVADAEADAGVPVELDLDACVAQDFDAAEVMARIERIHGRTREVLEVAKQSGRPPHEVADELAREIIRGAAKPMFRRVG